MLTERSVSEFCLTQILLMRGTTKENEHNTTLTSHGIEL